MNRALNTEKGFSPIILLIIVLALGLIVLFGPSLWQQLTSEHVISDDFGGVLNSPMPNEASPSADKITNQNSSPETAYSFDKNSKAEIIKTPDLKEEHIGRETLIVTNLLSGKKSTVYSGNYSDEFNTHILLTKDSFSPDGKYFYAIYVNDHSTIIIFKSDGSKFNNNEDSLSISTLYDTKVRLPDSPALYNLILPFISNWKSNNELFVKAYYGDSSDTTYLFNIDTQTFVKQND